MIQKRIVVGGGSSTDGYLFYLSGGGSYFISRSAAISGFDAAESPNLLLEFSVTTTVFQFSEEDTTDVLLPSINDITSLGENPIITNQTQLFDGSASESQTYYRFPIIIGGQTINPGGTYRENIYCLNNRLIAEFVKIG